MARYTKSRYTKVGVCIWSDSRFNVLSEKARYVWFYLITCPSAESIPGLIPMGRAAITEVLGWEADEFTKAFDEIARQGMAIADWPNRMVWVPKALLHNPPGNINILKHWFAELEKVPDSPLKRMGIESLGGYCKANGEGFAKAFAEAFPKGLPKAFQEALPEAFGNSNSNSDSNSNSESHHHQQQIKRVEAADDAVLKIDPRLATADADAQERAQLLEQLQAIEIAPKKAASLLAEWCPQKIQAALASLASRKRQGTLVKSEAGYVCAFLKKPEEYGYELVSQRGWVSSKEVSKKKQAVGAQPKRTAEEKRSLAAALAWESLDRATEKQIREEIDKNYPNESPAQRTKRRHEAALALKPVAVPTADSIHNNSQTQDPFHTERTEP